MQRPRVPMLRSRSTGVPPVTSCPVTRMLVTERIASLAAATIAAPSCSAKSLVRRSSYAPHPARRATGRAADRATAAVRMLRT